MLDTRWWKLASLWETGLWVHHCPFHSQTEMVSFFLPLLSNSRCSFSISNQHKDLINTKWYFYCVSVHQINLEDCGSYYVLHFLLSFVPLLPQDVYKEYRGQVNIWSHFRRLSSSAELLHCTGTHLYTSTAAVWVIQPLGYRCDFSSICLPAIVNQLLQASNESFLNIICLNKTVQCLHKWLIVNWLSTDCQLIVNLT